MHTTTTGNKIKALKRDARELAKDARILQKAARAPAARRVVKRLQGEAERALAEAEALKLQARLEGPECVGDEEGQAESQGLQDLHLLDGILARGWQDAQCAPGEQQKDGWRGGQPEGQGDEGGGAGDADTGLVIED